jgi:hypothetical protein
VSGDIQSAPYYGDIVEFNLPTMGTGTDPAAWPAAVYNTQYSRSTWNDDGSGGANNSSIYGNGVYCDKNNYFGLGTNAVLVAQKMYYNALPPNDFRVVRVDTGTYVDIALPRQAHSGFLLRSGAKPLASGTGPESGQGAVPGFTVCDMDTAAVLWDPWVSFSLNFNQRMPRLDTNYGSGTKGPPPAYQHDDRWYCLDPVNHGGLGCCGLDHYYGNGLVWPGDGMIYKQCTGFGQGVIDYNWQTEEFGQYAYGGCIIQVDPSSSYAIVSQTQLSLLAGGHTMGMSFGPDSSKWCYMERGAWVSPLDYIYPQSPILVVMG